ncbi:MAG: YraN family protein [Opitutales bacterium]
MFGWLKILWVKWRPDGSGARGERLAARHLERAAGCRIVARNWRNPRDRRDELDLVVRDGEILVFVEVKTRAAGALVPGYFAVDERKKRVVRRAARAYLAGLKIRPRTVRFDVVEVELPSSGAAAGPLVRHFANIPLFPRHFEPGG